MRDSIKKLLKLFTICECDSDVVGPIMVGTCSVENRVYKTPPVYAIYFTVVDECVFKENDVFSPLFNFEC